jgi:DNA-binding CsgD family transcriptional regulator
MADARDISAGAFVVDETRHIVAWNAEAEQLLGCSAAETIGRPCYEVLAFHGGRRERFCATHCPAGRGHTRPATTIEFLAQMANRGVRRLTMAALAAQSPSGRERIVHILLDPYERRPLVREVVAVAGGARSAPAAGHAPEGVGALGEQLEPEHLPHLSTRELEVLGMLAQGHTPGAIADILGISRVTVRNHLTHAMEKLDVQTRLQAIVVATRLRLI